MLLLQMIFFMPWKYIGKYKLYPTATWDFALLISKHYNEIKEYLLLTVINNEACSLLNYSLYIKVFWK